VSRIIVAVDLRQFFSHPYASGVQRVLLGLLDNWPGDEAELVVLTTHEGRLYFVTPIAAARCIRACFDFAGESSGTTDHLRRLVSAELQQHSRHETSWPEALFMVDRWLIAEPSADPALLKDWREASRVMPTTMIFYDALPQTHPEFFESSESMHSSAYFRLAASMPAVVSISSHVAETLIGRLRNDSDRATSVALPGADHLATHTSSAPKTTTFLVLSTVERRKRLGVIIGGFSAASDAVAGLRLHVVGRPSTDSSTVHNAMGKKSGSRIFWSSEVNDESLMQLATTSTALISIGEEGYGMPVVEMLRRGCPVVFAGTQPAAELAEGAGAMRLKDASAESVAAAMVYLSDHARATALRSSIDVDRLPTWQQFATTVARLAGSR
jgi:glycosyltransferase involved in cell wall biosynthesis